MSDGPNVGLWGGPRDAEFDQIVLIAEGSFAKKIIEDGAEFHGIDWSRYRVHVVTGEEGIAENYRSYVEGLLGIDDPELAGPGGA